MEFIDSKKGASLWRKIFYLLLHLLMNCSLRYDGLAEATIYAYYKRSCYLILRKYQEKNAAVLATCQKQFKHLGGYEPHEQENIFKKALMLDQKTYVLLAQRVLQDEDVRPLLRANTFLNLKHLAVTKAVSVINPVNLIMQQIIPAEVQEITASSSFQALKKYLEDDQQVPEDFKENYLQDFQFKMMLLYPFYTELDLAESRILYDSFVGKNQTQLSKWLQKAILAV